MRHKLDGIFRPNSVAVIGASTRKGTIGRETLHNILMAEFHGKVFPVNPKAPVIHSIKAYSTILDVPDPVDLAIIIVPKEFVKDVVARCGEKGVKGVIVISAGFSEVGPEGKKRELEVLQEVRKYGMRMIGPNCFGIVNTNPEINLNATFGKVFPKRGRIAFITQSGAMGEAIMNHASDLNIGFSIVASIGNKADMSSNDILDYLRDDPDTDIILLYLENFGNPRNFIRIAGELSRTKPMVAVKSGRTSLGAKAASSHTGALGGSEMAVDALFEQTGVMRVETVQELFDVAAALTNQPIPKGNRVVVITNAGGPGILATDALVKNGMEMPALSSGSIKKLKESISAEASFSNPMDMVAGAGPTEFHLTLDVLKKDKNFDTIIPIYVPLALINPMEVAEKIYDAVKDSQKTVLASFMGSGEGSQAITYLRDHKIPVYNYPEPIAKTLETIGRYANWLKKPKGKIRKFEVDSENVSQIIETAKKSKLKAIIGNDAIKILESYGIPAVNYEFADSPESAVKTASKIGYPVVMKINTPFLLHKTEAGGVLVDLRTDKEIRDGFTTLQSRINSVKGKEKFSVSIQKMVQGGVETVIGMTTDPKFGPIIMFGLGGIFVEIMKDVSFRIFPLTSQNAKEMIRALKSYPLLTGFRGAKPVDLATVEETLLRISQLVGDFDSISELDINPFIAGATPNACKAVDARFIIKYD